MKTCVRAGRRYLQFERLAEQRGLVHALSTRPLDISPRYDERRTERAARRATMAVDWDVDPAHLHHCEQVHQTRLAVITADTPAGPQAESDAILTATPGRGLFSFSADCPLLCIYAADVPALALVHASWRCTVAGLTRRVIDRLRIDFGCAAETLLAGIGPGAGPCCYEVRDDVWQAAAPLPDREACFARRDGRLYFDLWRANAQWLTQAGVPPERIESAGLCTMCRNDLLYSFRREGPGCGHFGLLAALTDSQ